MKYKTTAKGLKSRQYLIVGFGYCEIQNIERYLTPDSYTSGTYGWNCDIYDFGAYTISTGYRPISWACPADKKHAKQRAEYIKKEILKLEKALKDGKIKMPYNFKTCKKKITKKILHIIKKAYEIVYK